MKKEDKEKINLKSNLYSKQNIEIENFKTTNVNILLNRVRLDKKKNLKKKKQKKKNESSQTLAKH